MFTEAKDDGGGGDNWTTGAISRAKLQSDHHHQQTNTQFFTDRGCPSCRPTNSVKALKGKGNSLSVSKITQKGVDEMVEVQCAARTTGGFWWRSGPRYVRLVLRLGRGLCSLDATLSLYRGLGASSILKGRCKQKQRGLRGLLCRWPSITEWEMYITALGPRLRNDLYCVEWDVKLYYTIPYHCHSVSTSVIQHFKCIQKNTAWQYLGDPCPETPGTVPLAGQDHSATVVCPGITTKSFLYWSLSSQ